MSKCSFLCYRTINGILGSCESLCLLSEFFFFWKKIQKLGFWYFFNCVFFFCCGSLWIVVGRCGSFRVLVTTRLQRRLEIPGGKSISELERKFPVKNFHKFSYISQGCLESSTFFYLASLAFLWESVLRFFPASLVRYSKKKNWIRTFFPIQPRPMKLTVGQCKKRVGFWMGRDFISGIAKSC